MGEGPRGYGSEGHRVPLTGVRSCVALRETEHEEDEAELALELLLDDVEEQRH